jgi:hypothetical protein
MLSGLVANGGNGNSTSSNSHCFDSRPEIQGFRLSHAHVVWSDRTTLDVVATPGHLWVVVELTVLQLTCSCSA